MGTNACYESLIEDREHVSKLWGLEEIIVNNDKYCGKIMWLTQGYQSSLHYHDQKDETFLAIAGAIGVEYYPNKDQRVDTILFGWRRDALHLPPGTPHRFTALAPASVFIEFSTPHSDDDVTRLEPSRKIVGFEE